ncbi:unnamed protein product, partial [Nesidiocoris tenuis]
AIYGSMDCSRSFFGLSSDQYEIKLAQQAQETIVSSTEHAYTVHIMADSRSCPRRQANHLDWTSKMKQMMRKVDFYSN